MAIVWHSINFATVYSRVTEGGCGCWMEYECKLLCQFTTAVGGTRCYLCLKQSHSNSLQGHTKHFYSYLRIELSGSDWNAPRYLKNGQLVTSKQTTANWKIFFQKLFVWPCSDAVQIDRCMFNGYRSFLTSTVEC